MLIDICIKFHVYSLSGFQVIERTRFVTDRQTDGRTDRRTDRQTDRRPGKNNMSPDPKGGRHNSDILAEQVGLNLSLYEFLKLVSKSNFIGVF